jgi:hypothetical protein
MSTITAQVRALQTMPAAQLVARFTELFGKAPRSRNVAWLRREVAWKLQERKLGGLSERAKARLDELVARIDLPLGATTPPRPRPTPKPTSNDTAMPVPGTVLTREWRGQQLRVEVRDDGFIWNGTPFRSLSAVAKAITGATWSGALFFNLRKRSTSA